MNERFKKYLKTLHTEGRAAEEFAKAEKELHKSFATLSQTEQKFANLFLNDVQRGDVTPDPAKTFRDYIAEYMARAQNERIARIAEAFGLDAQKLRALVDVVVDERSLDEYDRFAKLIDSVDVGKARCYFEQKLGRKLRAPEVHMELDRILRRFILQEANGVETEE